MLSVCEQINYPIAQPSAEMVCYARMQTILYFHHGDDYASRLRLEGINAFARTLDWNVQCYEELVSARTLKTLREFWHPVGAILCPNNRREEFDASLFSPDSTVLLDCFPPDGLETFASIITDSFPATENVARELLAAKCRSYGFVPWHTTRIWSENRRHNLSRILAGHGIRMHEFAPSEEGLNARRLQEELIPWLRDLPKPCGIMAANDRIGENVIRACQLADIGIPFDCVVVGVDDDANVCENTSPTLSSVGLDFRSSGYRAGELLYELVSGRLPDRPIESVPPLSLTRRSSSRVFLQTDRHALRVSDLIRARACSGLQAREALALYPCSRRLAEIRFRQATGHSVLDEIRSVRSEHAKKLLANPYARLDTIAEQCGYESDTTFRRIFKEETGQTLRAYQRSLRH